MDWGIIPIPIAVIFFIISIILTLKLTKNKKPVWAYKTNKTIGLGTDAPRELKLTFDGRPVNDVYQTTFILFNKGKETIRQGDVTENVVINFEGAEILREPTVKVLSNEAIEFSAKRVVKETENSVKLDFLYLDREDGAVVEVIHTESQDISCTANIIGVKKLVNIGEFEESYPRFLGVRSIIFPILAIISISTMILFGFKIFTFIEEKPVIGAIVVSIASLCGGFFGAISLLSVPHYLRCRKFPRWSRKIAIKGASIKEGASIKAYCMHCRKKIDMKNPHSVMLKNGRPAARGVCPDCGTKVFRILT